METNGVMTGISGVRMTGTMMTGPGMKVNGMVSGFVLSTIGPVTGLGTRMTGLLGLRTGPGTVRNGGILLRFSRRARMVPSCDCRFVGSECAQSVEDCSGNKARTDDELVRWSVLVDWRAEFRSATNADSECAKLDANARK